MSRNLWFVPLLLATGVVLAEEVPEAERVASSAEAQAKIEAPTEAPGEAPTETQAQVQADEGPKVVSGMSILGNRDAPKSLVIVPWKSSVIGDSLGISTVLDDSRQPIDKEVFMRALSYYEIRSEKTP